MSNILKSSRPVSRVLSRTVIYLGISSRTHSSNQPRDITRRVASLPLFGLAPDGVYQTGYVTITPVSSYLTFSTLPASLSDDLLTSAVCFLWHFPLAFAILPLGGISPYGARTFLRSYLKDLIFDSYLSLTFTKIRPLR